MEFVIRWMGAMLALSLQASAETNMFTFTTKAGQRLEGMEFRAVDQDGVLFAYPDSYSRPIGFERVKFSELPAELEGFFLAKRPAEKDSSFVGNFVVPLKLDARKLGFYSSQEGGTNVDVAMVEMTNGSAKASLGFCRVDSAKGYVFALMVGHEGQDWGLMAPDSLQILVGGDFIDFTALPLGGDNVAGVRPGALPLGTFSEMAVYPATLADLRRIGMAGKATVALHGSESTEVFELRYNNAMAAFVNFCATNRPKGRWLMDDSLRMLYTGQTNRTGKTVRILGLDAEETGVTRQWSWRVILQARSNVASRRLAFTFTDKAGLSVKQEIKTVSIKAGEMQTVTGLTTLTPAQAKRVEKFKASVQ